jgi:hypothetical protein
LVCLNPLWENEEAQKTCGILRDVEKKIGWLLSHNITQTVIQFYENDEYSHVLERRASCLWNRDLKKQHEQKGLVLCNIHEMDMEFHEKHPAVSIGLWKFVELCQNTASLQVQKEPIQNVSVWVIRM